MHGSHIPHRQYDQCEDKGGRRSGGGGGGEGKAGHVDSNRDGRDTVEGTDKNVVVGKHALTRTREKLT